MHLLYYIAFVIGLFAAVGTFLPFLPYDDFWIRGFDFPRLQLLFLLLVGIAGITFIPQPEGWRGLNQGLQFVCFAAIAFQIYRITPYLAIAPVEVITVAEEKLDTTKQFDLLISNVLQTNTDYSTLIDYVVEREPDVLLTLETNKDWEKELITGLPEAYQYSIKVPLENRYGMHLFSRLPIRNQEVMYLISDSIPSIYTQVQLSSDQWINLYCVHPTPPSPTEEIASTGRDAELATIGKMVSERDNANTIVAGDLNDVAWSHSTRLFKRLSGLFDPRKGRGLFSSYNAEHWFMRWPLDHIFHSDEFQVVEIGLGPYFGSDHFPIEVILQYVPEEKNKTKEETPEKGDQEEANETIEKAKRGESDGLLVD